MTLSIVNGFKNELKIKLFSISPVLYVYSVGSDPLTVINDFNKISDFMASEKDGAPSVISYHVPGLLKSDNDFSAINLMAYDDIETERLFLNRWVDTIETPPAKNELFLSSNTAKALSTKTGDAIDVIFPTDNGLKYRRVKIGDIYSTGLKEYDENVAIVNSGLIFNMMRTVPQSVIKLELKTSGTDYNEIEKKQRELRNKINNLYSKGEISQIYGVGNIYDDAGSYFGWLNLLDTNILIIIILMSAISVFTLICSLTIIVLENIPTTGILKALGANNSQMRNVFMLIGIRMLTIALLISNIFCFILIYAQNTLKLLPLDADSYYLSFVPMELSFASFAIVDIIALCIGFSTLLMPVAIIHGTSLSSLIKYQ